MVVGYHQETPICLALDLRQQSGQHELHDVHRSLLGPIILQYTSDRSKQLANWQWTDFWLWIDFFLTLDFWKWTNMNQPELTRIIDCNSSLMNAYDVSDSAFVVETSLEMDYVHWPLHVLLWLPVYKTIIAYSILTAASSDLPNIIRQIGHKQYIF